MLPVGKMRHFWRIFKHCIIAAPERDQLMKLRIEDDTVWTHLLKSLTFEFSRQIFILSCMRFAHFLCENSNIFRLVDE